MSNPFHTTRQLEHPETPALLDAWLTPAHLGQACYYARVDVVRAMLATGASPDRLPDGGQPIAAAAEAWVTTPLHVECVQALLEAGARPTPDLLRSNLEAVGSEVDFELLSVIAEAGRRDDDPEVRAAAEAVNVDALREWMRRLRERRGLRPRGRRVVPTWASLVLGCIRSRRALEVRPDGAGAVIPQLERVLEAADATDLDRE